jgi:hypothetical protein
MANPRSPADISETMAAPLGDLIAAVGRGLAGAQQSLDMATFETIRAMYKGDDAALEIMRQLGWQPTWYRIPELAAELTLSLSVSATETGAGQGPGAVQLYGSPMDASYTNRYDYDLQAASVVKFKIVAVPPAVELGERKIVPALKDKTLAQARQRLADLGIPFQFEKGVTPPETATVQDTVPGEGELLGAGEKVTLKLYA